MYVQMFLKIPISLDTCICFFVNTEKWSEIFSKDEKEKGINILFLVFVHFQECVSVV